MSIVETTIQKETRDRYLTYALSVVSGRALPDVRDGLKPVQRRILYAMLQDLNLRPTNGYRKSAAVVGQVLAKLHPHGDIPCYEAMVRMAQEFSYRYPLVDGQGNFGSIDGDSAAAYRYTEARLRELAIEVIGEIDEETVAFRDNFDATWLEPVVLPSRVPNLLVNGAQGIAVGMATSIPPHNLRDTVKALIELSNNPEKKLEELVTIIKGPDFPSGCLILNTRKELNEIYRTGRGMIRMRGEWDIEEGSRGKRYVVVTSIPYAVNKSQLVEKIAGLIIDKKVPQLTDVRDESTDDVRIVLELASGADPEVAMAYLVRNTSLETNFAVNLTALVPVEGGSVRPELLSLKQCLQHFLDFREEVTEKRLVFEKKKLEERIHILEGLVIIYDHLDEALKIIRGSEGRSDAAERLRKRFKLSEIQSFAIVDMRLYQLSRTNIHEVRDELKAKAERVSQIEGILKSKGKIAALVRKDLEALGEKFGDKRLCKLERDNVELEFKAEDYVVHEDVFAIVTKDGWLKRIRQSNELDSTRLREGDAILDAHPLSTLDSVMFFTNLGSLYTLKVTDFPSSSGYGNPIQKTLKFKDDERVVASFPIKAGEGPSAPALSEGSQQKLFGEEGAAKPVLSNAVKEGSALVLVSSQGVGFALVLEEIGSVKRSGKRAIKLREGDTLAAVCHRAQKVAIFSRDGFGLAIEAKEIPERTDPAVGVSLLGLRKDDVVIGAIGITGKDNKIVLKLDSGGEKEISAKEIAGGHRALKGNRVIARGGIQHLVSR